MKIILNELTAYCHRNAEMSRCHQPWSFPERSTARNSANVTTTQHNYDIHDCVYDLISKQ